MKATTMIQRAVLPCLCLGAAGPVWAAEALSPPARPGLWAHSVGEGYLRSAQEFGVNVGAGFGMDVMGCSQHHDMVLGAISYGHMLGDVKGEGHFYRGNFEFLLEAFSGGQFYPKSAYLVGLTPHLRYNFATGTRWVPFFDIGAGLTATDIHGPDLGDVFQFNLQAGGGVNYFVRDNVALSFEYRFLHLSSGSISLPNLGVNTSMFMAGVHWFF